MLSQLHVWESSETPVGPGCVSLRRAQRLHRGLRARDIQLIFHDDNDLRALCDDLRLGRQLTDQVNTLPPYSHLFVNQVTGVATGPTRTLERITPSGRFI